MLEIHDLHGSYGRVKVLKGISLEIRQGEIACLIGANGAGKTTTLNTICGVIRPNGGRILYKGQEITSWSMDQIVKAGICQVPEGRKIFPTFTVLENLRVGAFSRSDRNRYREDAEAVFEQFPILKARQNQLGGKMSGGEQQMLAIGRALMSKPDLLLLDEPSLGLSPIMAKTIWKTIRAINQKGMTILLVEQNAAAALHLSEKGYVMETGRIAMEDRCVNLLQNEEIRNAYLG
jgi:branched-chain amino acid transport system ATP-binding protein